MNTWFAFHLRAAADAARRLAGSPLNTLLALIAIAIALALPAGGKLILDNLARLGQRLVTPHQVSIFLTPQADKKARDEIETRLKSWGMQQLSFVSKETALKSLAEESGLSDVISGLPQNPLPDAFIAEPSLSTPQDLEKLAETARTWPQVAHVQSDTQWAKKLQAFLRLGRLGVAVLAVVLGAGLIAVIFNTIRLQVLSRANEIEVALMIGATPAYIRRPFNWLGILQGGLGALLAWLLVHMTLRLLQGPASDLSALYGGEFILQGLSLPQSLLLIAGGALLGWLGARLSVALSLRSLESFSQK